MTDEKRLIPAHSTNILNLLASFDKFNSDGSYKTGIPKITEIEKNNATKKWDSHRAYLTDLKNIAVLYGYNNYYPRSIPENYYAKAEYKSLIYNSLKWYFKNFTPPVSVYHETFTYHPYDTSVTGLLGYIGMLLYDDFHADRKTDFVIQQLFENIVSYCRHVITDNPQTRGPNWSFRYGNCLRHVIFSNDPLEMDAFAKVNNASLNFDTWAENGTDGIWPDWSLTHHGDENYWGMYGVSWLSNTLELASILKETPWEYSQENIRFIESSVIEGLQWILYKGNTEITTAPKRLTYWLDRTDNVASEVVDQLSNLIFLHADKLENKAMIEYLIKNIDPSWQMSDKQYNEVSGHKYYWNTEYQVHRRSNYSFAVRRTSQRVRGPEDSSNENITCHLHFGSGYTSILRRGNEYRLSRLGFDYQTLPGTTTERNGIVNAGKSASQRRGFNLFSGGVSDGEFGAGAFEMKLGDYRNDTQKWDVINGAGALKGYFFFSNEMVCLGQEVKRINAGTNEIWTTINQMQRSGEVVYSIDGNTPVTIGLNETENRHLSVGSAAWFWHDQVGYLIRTNSPAQLKLMAERRQLNPILMEDSYKNAIAAEDNSSGTINMFQLAINHGVNPENDQYNYRVIPDVTLDNFCQLMKLKTVEIIQNSNKIQAVYNAFDEVLEVVFFEPGELNLPDGKTVKVDKKAILMLRRIKDEMLISAANPVHQGLRPSFVESASKTIGELYESPVNIELSGFEIQNLTDKKYLLQMQLPSERGYEGQTVTQKIQLKANSENSNHVYPFLNGIMANDSALANFSPTRFAYKILAGEKDDLLIQGTSNPLNQIQYIPIGRDTLQIKVTKDDVSISYSVIVVREKNGAIQPEICDEYTETFTLLENTGDFMSKSFVGDNNIGWTINSAKYDNSQGTGGGVYIRSGFVESQKMNTGISEFSVTLLNKWNDSGKTVKATLLINDREIAINENNSNGKVYTFSVQNINISGEVQIKIKNTSGETTSLAIDNISWKPYLNPVSHASSSQNEQIKVYPNPFSDQITVLTNSLYNKLELFNLSGNKIMEMSDCSSNTIKIDPLLPEGLYFLKVSTNDYSTTHKIIKTKQ